MSLRTDYFDGITGLQAKINDAYDAGVAFVAANLSDLTSKLQAQAAAGNTSFTVSLLTTYLPSTLRGNKGNNYILKAYLAGVQGGMAGQEIYSFEVAPSLNAADSTDTYIDLKFSFQTT